MKRETTLCQKCKQIMPIDEFLTSDRCPYCGANFVAAQFKVDLFLAIAVSAIGWIIYLISPETESLLIAFAMTGGTGFFLIVTYIIEKVLSRTTELNFNKRHKYGMTTSIIILVLILFIIVKLCK